ncbi:response regulator transcription factor [Pontivivens ytuae]|uniref:Response regulator transcription factor n=1 Tax=Pontivivens ytuae TaxID=2789856 RepID=A0A7S9QD33_9RHOB|nr:response regulator transcription factor [Pontivivens ytuae]QPH54873.1 response regulator transcription factor [Pontivivens ytuae]
MSASVLIVDEDAATRQEISHELSRHGFAVETAKCANQARDLVSTRHFDLTLLEADQPGDEGLVLTQWLVEGAGVSVIVLSRRADVPRQVQALELGASDYIGKPFHMLELVARVKNALRVRPSRVGDKGMALRYRFGEWQLDTIRREMSRGGGRTEHLSASELSLLLTFLRQPHQIIRRDILAATMGVRGSSDRSVDALVSKLRRKLEQDPKEPTYIQTVWARGYRFAAPVQELD